MKIVGRVKIDLKKNSFLILAPPLLQYMAYICLFPSSIAFFLGALGLMALFLRFRAYQPSTHAIAH